MQRNIISSPCKKICKLNTDKNYCVSCFRYLSEILAWAEFTEDKRNNIMNLLKWRNMNERTFSIPLTITEANISDTIISAVEGEVGYWFGFEPNDNPWCIAWLDGVHPKSTSFAEELARVLISGETVIIHDANDSDNAQWHLTLDVLLKGFERYFNDPDWSMPFSEHCAADADAILQFGLFEGVKYE